MVVAIASGFIAGLIHVFAGPDHLAAIAPLTAHRPGRGWGLGVRWGLGHASGVAGVALLALLARGALPVDRMSSWAERFVGVVLIAIGFWGLKRAWRHQVHSHEHEHDGDRHAHFHVHPDSGHPPVTSAQAHFHRHTHAAFAVGILHGLAGTSHFLGVLPALGLPTPALAGAYLIGFGAGTVCAMAAFSGTLDLVARRLAFGGRAAYRSLMVGCSGVAMFLGGYWLLR